MSLLQQRRLSGIPLANPVGSNNWQTYQPFVLHTADDISVAQLPFGSSNNNNYAPSHAVAFRTVDLTDQNDNPPPFADQTSYGGGKLGIYSYWNTCGAASAPIRGINSSQAPNQYEFYNYSQHAYYEAGLTANPQEVGNQFFDASGNNSAQGQNYYNDFFNVGSNMGIPIQGELYQLDSAGGGLNTQQVVAAIQVAFQNYLDYLACNDMLTGNNGWPSGCASGCANYSP